MYTMIVPHIRGEKDHKFAFILNGRLAEIRNIDITEMLTWAEAHFGSGADIHGDDKRYMAARWCYSSNSWNFWFHREEDAFAFKLRWC